MKRNAIAALFMASVFCAGGVRVASQAPDLGTAVPSGRDRFDVASVRRNTTGEPLQLRIGPGNRVVAINAPLRQIVWRALGIHRVELVGGPAWIDTESYNIDARAGGTPSLPQLERMLLSLLEERFSLRAERQTREMPLYELQLVQNGRLGPRLTRSMLDCQALAKQFPMPELPWSPSPQIATAEENAASENRCGFTAVLGANSERWRFRGVPTAAMIPRLRSAVDRIVIDRTGLEGQFDFELEKAGNYDGRVSTSTDPSGPVELFTALQEQLGMKLVGKRAAVPVMVIERIRRPTEN